MRRMMMLEDAHIRTGGGGGGGLSKTEIELKSKFCVLSCHQLLQIPRYLGTGDKFLSCKPNELLSYFPRVKRYISHKVLRALSFVTVNSFLLLSYSSIATVHVLF